MPSKMDVILELDRRGALPDKQAAVVAELKKRGEIKSSVPTKDWQKKAAISATRAEHPILAGTLDFLAGASELSRGALNLLPGDLGDKLYSSDGLSLKEVASPDSPARIAGSFVDPVAWGVGLEAGKVLPYTKVLGGGVLNAAKAIGINLAGGAVPGAVVGALSEQGDAVSGGVTGAITNSVVPPTVSLIAKGGGRLWTAMHVKERAANLLKKIVGSDLAAFRSVLASANPDDTAAQAAASIDNDVFNALDSLARKHDVTGHFKKLDSKHQQDLIDDLVKLAGAPNQTEARQVTEASKASLNAITGGIRETELGAANIAGDVIKTLEPKASRFEAAASGKSRDVARISQLQQKATDLGNKGNMTLSNADPASALPRLPGRYSYGHELANVGEKHAQSAADSSLLLGEVARDARKRIDSLAEHGLQPIDTSALTSKLGRMIDDPKIGPSNVNKRVLEAVANRINEWTSKNGGVIDAEALYTIRQSAIADEVESLLASSSPKVKNARAAALLIKVRPLIDDAIVAAGGTGWRNYLSSFENGMRIIERRQMGAVALDLLKKNPGKLVSLVAGNEPKIVEGVFKTEYNLGAAMGAEMMKPLENAAASISRDAAIKEGGRRGKTALGSILSENTARFRMPNWINRNVAITNRGLEEIESHVNKKTMAAIYQAMRSGKDANALLSVVPIEERSVVIQSLLKFQKSPQTRAFMMGLLSAGQDRSEETE